MIGEKFVWKKCYDYCHKYCFKIRKSSILVLGDVSYTSDQILQYAIRYIQTHISSIYDYNEISLCWDDDLQEFFKKYRSIVDMSMLKHSDIIDYGWVRKNFKKFVREFSYDLFVAFNWDAVKIQNFCDRYSIKIELMDQLVEQYGNFQKVHWNEKQWIEFRNYYNQYYRSKVVDIKQVEINNERLRLKRERSNSKRFKLFQQLLDTSDKTEIIQLIGTMETLNYLRLSLSDYLVTYWHGDKSIETNIQAKLQLFIDHYKYEKMMSFLEKDRKKKIDMLETARLLISWYLECDYSSVQSFCDDVKMDTKAFMKYVQALKDAEDVLYDQYHEYSSRKNDRCYAMLVKICKNIVHLIEIGILENGKQRRFDLIDYYQHTSIDFHHFKSLIKGNVSKKEYVCFNQFVNRYVNDKFLHDRDIFDIKVMIGAQFDANKRMIVDTGREVTDEEKKAILNFIKVKGVPLTQCTYEAAFQRWKNGFINIDLFLDENSSKVKSLKVHKKV